ncbi:hypothetical protein PG984_016196 [Apiospora sp. TS-2023a]
MFQVLRQADQRDGTCTLESATPREGQNTATRLACLRCREKKVRCTGEKDGCQRCHDKRVPCSYAAPTRPESSSSSSSSSSEDPPVPTDTHAQPSSSGPPPAAEHRPTPSVPEAAPLPPPTGTPQQVLSETAAGNFATTFEEAIEVYDFHADMAQFVSMDAEAFESLGALPNGNNNNNNNMDVSFALFESHLHDPFLAMSGSDSTDPSHLTLSPDQSSIVARSGSGGTDGEEPPPPPCHSSHDMLRTFEAVEVCLMWTQRGSGPGMAASASSSLSSSSSSSSPSLRLEEMLACQKEVLESCRARLGCPTCHLQSCDVVILINICEKILGSIVRIQAVVQGCQREDRDRSHRPRSSSSSLLSSSRRISSPLNNDSSAGTYALVEQITNPDRKRPRGGGGGDGGGRNGNGNGSQSFDNKRGCSASGGWTRRTSWTPCSVCSGSAWAS